MLDPGRGDEGSFLFHFFQCQGPAVYSISGIEPAVGALVLTNIRKIHGSIKLDGASEMLEGQRMGSLRHRFQKSFSRRRKKRPKLFGILHIRLDHALNCLRRNIAEDLFERKVFILEKGFVITHGELLT